MFSKAKELLLQQKQKTIADFENKLKKQQDRIKKVKLQQHHTHIQNENRLKEIRMKWMGVVDR